MALLGRIRQYGFVMMILIVVAVFGFLFMDVSSVGRGFSGQGRILGSIGGQDITRDEFDSYIRDYERMGASNDEQTRAFVWKELVNDLIFKIQSNKLGIGVSEKEIEDMFIGENISPVVMEALGGQVDKTTLQQQRSSYIQVQQKSATERNEREQEYFETWQTIEKRAISQRVSAKYLNLIAKSSYAPGWLANSEFQRNSRSYDINYVRVMYTDIPNNQIKVSDEDLTNYINENPKKYEREANVSLDYVFFEVFPTAQDSMEYLAKMNDLAQSFKSTANDTTFVSNNRGSMEYKYVTKTDMKDPESAKDSIASRKKGDVVGPFTDSEGNYKLVKILDARSVIDSVKCRHIFLPADRRDMSSLQRNYGVLDSLKKLILEKKSNFDSLVAQNSMDLNSKMNGGNIGWRKKGDAYGQNFEDYILHVGKKDSFDIIQSNDGLHLIQITEFKYGKEMAFKLAVIKEPIIPSTKTEEMIENQANEFMANNRTLDDLNKAIKKNSNLKKSSAYGLTINDFKLNEQISGSVAVEIIRWAHKEGKVNEVAGQIFPVNDAKNSYTSMVVIPALVSKSEKGLASIQDPNVKLEVEQIVRNKKKADMILTKLKSVNNLESVAQYYPNAKVENAASLSYSSPFIPSIGVEPKVLGAAEALSAGKTSKAFEGNQAVYMIQLLNKRDGQPVSDINMVRKSVSDRMLPGEVNQLRDFVSEAVKDILKLKDNRADMY